MTGADMLRSLLFIAALAWPLAAAAGDTAILVEDAFARASSPTAKAGAAFMLLTNTTDSDDRLLGAASDAAMRVELHTHVADDGGVMRMRPLEGGVALPAKGSHALARGGDHLMFMGLTRPFLDGDTITVTLTFEIAGEIEVEIPVDLSR